MKEKRNRTQTQKGEHKMTNREAKTRIVARDLELTRMAYVLRGHAGAMSVGTSSEMVFDYEAKNNAILQKELEKELAA